MSFRVPPTGTWASVCPDPACSGPQVPRRSRPYRLAEHFPWTDALELAITPVLVFSKRAWAELAGKPAGQATPVDRAGPCLFTELRRLLALYRSLGLEPLVLADSLDRTQAGLPLEGEFLWQASCEGARLCLQSPAATIWQTLADLCRSDILLHPVTHPFLSRCGLVLLLEAYAGRRGLPADDRESALPGTCLRACWHNRPGWPALMARETVLALAGGLSWQKDLACGDRLPCFEVANEGVVHQCDEILHPDRIPQDTRLAPEEALRLLQILDCPKRGILHGCAVGRVARALAQCYRLHGVPLDPDLACAAGYVHDIAKGYRHHEGVGASWLDFLGLPDMARCVRDHRDLVLADKKSVSERELVYLADKYCFGPRFVTLKQRFGQKMELFADSPHALAGIRRRLAHAEALEARIARELGHSPEILAARALA